MRKLWASVLALLQINAFSEENGVKMLTAEQYQKLSETFGEAFATKFAEDLKLESAGQAEDSSNAQAIAGFKASITGLEAAKAALETEKADLIAKHKALEATAETQRAAITALSEKPEPPAPPVPVGQNPETLDDTNEKFLFGQNLPFMAISPERPYNQRAFAAIMAKQGVMIPTMEASSMDYSSLKTDLGDYYRIRKQDRIQSFLLKLPSLENIFGLESGYQDQAALANMFLTDEFSQAENTIESEFANVVKGGYKFEAEILTMYDVMFAHTFKGLKALEKNWLGYLNREGSSTMKWSFIEYILVETGKKLHNERELRRMNGKRINPTANVPGTALGAADGLRTWLKKQIGLFKIRPFALGEWTELNISDYVRRGTQMVPSVIRDSGMLKLYLSPDAVVAYHKNNEQLYGVNQDYKANVMYVKEYPNVQLVPVPNMSESKRMIWTIEGNIKLFEDKPGEMYNFNLEQSDWSLKVWSNWKESVWAYLVGRKYASANLIPEDFSTQMIFCNDVDQPTAYFVPMLVDDATPSVVEHSSLVSVANTLVTAITDIDDCAIGQEVRLKCGNATNAVTIAAAGKFSLLTAAWTPGVGDVIVLKKRSDGKFIELARIPVSATALPFDSDATTPDVSGGDTFITDANSAPTVITNLTNGITGRTYTIYGKGTATNASSIATGTNFVLVSAMSLIAGTFIKLQKGADGKFYEISRSA